MKIGAQLYNLREYCKTTADLEETIKKVADMGFTNLQLSGVCAYDPEWMRDTLNKYGITCSLTHFSFDRIKNEPETVMNEHLTYGCKYIGIGGRNNLLTDNDLNDVIGVAKTSGKIFAEGGCRFMYHNHHGELNKDENGVSRLDALLNATTPEELGITVDTYWLQYAGCDVADWIKKLKGRIPCVHFKDMKVNGLEVRMAPVGSGNINFEKLIPLCAESGAEYIIIEQDNSYGEDPFEELRKGYKHLRSLGLE